MHGATIRIVLALFVVVITCRPNYHVTQDPYYLLLMKHVKLIT